MEQVWNSATLMQCQRGHEYKPLLPPGRGLPPPPSALLLEFPLVLQLHPLL